MLPAVPKNWTGRLLVVGEAPGEHEDTKSQRPFTGAAGRLLRAVIKEAGYQPDDVALVNSNRCRPPGNATPNMLQVRACRPFLLRVIDLLRPEAVLGVGVTAARALSNANIGNLTKMRGRAFRVPGLSDGYDPLVLVSYHPAAILRGNTEARVWLKEDLERCRGKVRTLTMPDSAVPVLDRSTLAVDTEYVPDEPGVLTISVADDDSAAAADLVELENPGPIIEAISDASVLVGHNFWADLPRLAELMPLKRGWITGESVLDSQLLARMWDENRPKGGYELETFLLSIAKPEKLWKGNPGTEKAVEWSHEYRKDRCRLDSWASYQIADCLYPKVVTNENDRKLVTFTHQIAALLHRMTLYGAFVDMDLFNESVADMQAQMLVSQDRLLKAAIEAGMENFSPTKDEDIRELVYERLGYEPNKRTKKGHASVEKAQLRLLDHPAIEHLLEFNKYDKLYSVNGKGVQKLLRYPGLVEGRPVGWLPFRINPLGARTGRRASSNPNSQNWPKSIRSIIRSRWPGGMIGDFDYRRLEVVIIAWLAGDDLLMHNFTEGGGYIAEAKNLWGRDVEEGTPEYTATKSVILGVHYNMQTPLMAENLWNMVLKGGKIGIRFSADYDEHEKETGRIRQKYLDLHKPIQMYMDDRRQEWLRTGQVRSFTGRVRHLPVPEKDGKGFGHMLNQAINFPVQSLASEITGSAMLDIEGAVLAEAGISYEEYYSRLLALNRKYLTGDPNGDIITDWEWELPINEVHDDVVMDFPPHRVKQGTELVVETMRSVPTLRKLWPNFGVPLNVDPKVGSRWGKSD